MTENPVIIGRNPRWANKEKTLINLEVNFPHIPEEFVDFTASETDCEAHGREIFELAKKKRFGPVAAYVEPETT